MLSFIAFAAGSELYLPELRSLIRTIVLITGVNALLSHVICARADAAVSDAAVSSYLPHVEGFADSDSHAQWLIARHHGWPHLPDQKRVAQIGGKAIDFIGSLLDRLKDTPTLCRQLRAQ